MVQFNAKAILLQEQQWCYLTYSWKNKGVHSFTKGICPKVNVIVRLEFELAYYDSVVLHFNHYTTRTTPDFFLEIAHSLNALKTNPVFAACSGILKGM